MPLSFAPHAAKICDVCDRLISLGRLRDPLDAKMLTCKRCGSRYLEIHRHHCRPIVSAMVPKPEPKRLAPAARPQRPQQPEPTGGVTMEYERE